MLRRQFHSQELRYDHEYTPRKQRQFAPGGQFQPTWLYRKQIYRPQGPKNPWIGKFFIPTGSVPANPEKTNYVREYDVMKKTGRYSYRILYAVVSGDKYTIKSKPSVEGRPNQLNLILNTDNRILDVQYY